MLCKHWFWLSSLSFPPPLLSLSPSLPPLSSLLSPFLSLPLPSLSSLLLLFSFSILSTQLVLFAQTKFALTDFIRENTGTFVNLFVAKPVDNFDQTLPIPSPIAYLYTMDDVLNQINFTSTAVSLSFSAVSVDVP